MATTSLQAHRDVLLSRSRHWSRAVRNDGLVFTLFSGSTGQTYWTTERSCNCRGFTFRQTCAHVAAVQADAEKARAAAVRRPRATYESLFGSDDELESAF